MNIHEAKAKLSHYLKMVQDGATVIICKRDVPIAELRPPKPMKKRELGHARKMYPNFTWDSSALLEPMSEEEWKLWEGPLVSEE